MADTRDSAPLAADGGTISARHEHLTDEALIGAIARRDHAALAEVYSQHGGRVHGLARALCGDASAEDLTQEVFLQLWKDPLRFTAEQGSLRRCLVMQAYKRAVESLRSHNGSSARESTSKWSADLKRSGAEAVARSLLDRAQVGELVAALPADERHSIVLAYFGGNTYRDVARVLAVPEEAIKSRIRSGLKRLRAKGATASLTA